MESFISSLSTWFYCQKIWHTVFIVIFATAVVFYIDKAVKKNHAKIFFGFLLLIWFLTVLSSTVITRSSVDAYTLTLKPFESYLTVLKGGNIELLRSNYMNILLFYPAGLLYGLIFRKGKSFLWGTMLFCFVSLMIETVQYLFSLGYAEIDDVIHNTAGFITGCAISYLFRFVSEKTKTNNGAMVE